MNNLKKYIRKILVSELVTLIIFGIAYKSAFYLPTDENSIIIRRGIIFLYGISAISLPFIVNYLSKRNR